MQFLIAYIILYIISGKQDFNKQTPIILAYIVLNKTTVYSSAFWDKIKKILNILRTKRNVFRFYVEKLMKEWEGETKDTEKIATFLDFVVFYMFIDYGKRNQYLSMLERVYDIVELEIDEVKKISKLEKLKSVSFIKMIFNRLTQLPEWKDYILNNICPVILDIIYEAEQNNEDEFLKVDHEESKVVDQQEADVYHKIVKKIIRSIFDSSSDIPQIIKIFLQIVKIFYVNKMVWLRLNTNEKSPK